MTRGKRIAAILNLTLLLMLPLAGTAAVVHYADGVLQQLVSTGAEVTVPAGDTHRLVMPDGSRVMVAEGSTYKVVSVDGELRVVLVAGTASFLVADGGKMTKIVDGHLIEAVDGAEVVITHDSSGSKIAHANKKGGLSINGTPVQTGVGGVIEADGTFSEDPAETINLMADHGGLIKDSGLPVPERALKKMPKHAREIVEENTSDISPS